MAETNGKKKDPERGQTEPPQQRFEVFSLRNPDFAGERAGVKFVGGIGRTDDPTAASECERLGYSVRDLGRLPKFEVHTPTRESSFTGERDGLQFFKGVARTDDEKVADQFGDLGYEVLEVTVRRKSPAAK